MLAALSPAHAAPTLPQAISADGWPHTASDLVPDPQARYGRLPNGMRYILYRNTATARSTAMRFQIAAGSMEESDRQRGLAHFVEHMAFRGSTNLPDGDLQKVLSAQGFDFGSDVNAFTGYETTDYVLNLPNNDNRPIQSALLILREIAGNLTFPQEAIDKERGVILGEERLRASSDARSDQAYIEAAYPSQLYARRNPIGLVDTIKTAPRQDMVDFYKTWYRPELATLIVVGDFDPAALEKRIKAIFSDWQPALTGPVPQVDYGARAAQGVGATVYSEKNLTEGVGAVWTRPFIDAADTAAARRRGFIKGMVADVITDRLTRLADGNDAPFLSASVEYDNDRLEGNTTRLWVVPKPGKQKEAFDLALKTVDQVRRDGITQGEIDEYLTEKDAGVVNMLRTTQTEDSSDLADDFLSDLDDNGVAMSPQQSADLWQTIRPGATIAAAAEQTAFLFSGDGPMLARTGETAADMDPAALKTTYDAAEGQTAGAWAANTTVPWAYTSFGTPVKPARKTEVGVLNYAQYTFPNGVKLNIKPNPLVRNEISVTVRFGGGYLLFSPQEHVSLMQLHLYDIVDGGLGKMTRGEIDKALSTKTVGVTYNLDDDHADLAGFTTRDSFAAEMQLLMAYTTDAGFRPESFTALDASLGYLYKHIRASPDFTLNLGLAQYLTNDDPRYVMPSEADAARISPDTYKSIYRRTLTHVPVEITIAGDISEESALDQVERTFATLPSVPSSFAVAPGADTVHLPVDRAPRTFIHEGRSDQAVSVAVFPTTDEVADVKTTMGLQLLAAIFQERLTQDLRETQGATYTVDVNATGSDVFKGYGYLTVEATVKPDADPAFFAAVKTVAGDLATKGVSKDELDRARNPLLPYMTDDIKSNADWQGTLSGLDGNKQLWALRVGQAHHIGAISPDDIRRLAQTYLKPDTVLRARVAPEEPPAK